MQSILFSLSNVVERAVDRPIGFSSGLAGDLRNRCAAFWTAIIAGPRNKAGLTQAQLAKLIGTKQPVISQLEDADYGGHSLSMLKRIADALGKRIEIRFVDSELQKSA